MTGIDLTWDDTITGQWGDGAFLGNGLLGAMIYGDREDPAALQWELGRTDVCAHYHIEGIDWNMPRIFIGELVLKPAGTVRRRTMRLDVDQAEATGTLETDRGRLQWRSFIPRAENIVVIEVDGEAAAELTFRERWGVSPRIYDCNQRPEELPVDQVPPRPIKGTVGEIQTVVQPLTRRGAVAVAWSVVRDGPGRQTLFCSISQSHDESRPRDTDVALALREAVETLEAARARHLDAILAGHRRWWRDYYALSELRLPDDPKWERFFWLQMYKLGCAARSDVGIVMDQLGPWMTQVAWPATWWNANVQMAYAPCYATNHLDIGHSLVAGMNRIYQQGSFTRNTPVAFRHDSLYVGRSTSVDGLGDECNEGANLIWALHNYWRQWRCSMDDRLIDESLFPLLKGAVNYLLHLLEEGADGRLHLPPLHSPEYTGSEGWDCHADIHYALALLRWGLRTLLDLDERFQKRDPQRTVWTDTLAHLCPLPVDEHGYRVAAEIPFDRCHRHYSHLMAMYPLHLLTPRDAESTALFRTSLERWVGFAAALPPGKRDWAAFSYPAASALHAMLGEGDKSLAQMDEFLKHDTIKPNTMLLEADGRFPSLESPLLAVEGLTYLLLQTWDDTIRVFPAVPAKWNDVSFRDFRAEGAFLVSGERTGGVNRWVTVKSLAGEPLRVIPNLPCADEDVVIGGLPPTRVTRRGSGLFELKLLKGETVRFEVGDR